MALYGCSGGGGSPVVVYTLYKITSDNQDLWADNGTTFSFTLTAPKSVVLTVTVTSNYSHEETITVDGSSFTNGDSVEAGTHTVAVTITGYHYGTTKTGTLTITGKSKAAPTMVKN